MNTHLPIYQHSEYLEELVQTHLLRKSISDAIDHLQFLDFDAIAFRGLSGALISPTLALMLEKTLCAVRKPSTQEVSHGFYQVEGDQGARRYIIVDDFISSGTTVCDILKEMAAYAPAAVCVGFYSVRDKRFAPLSIWRAEKLGFDILFNNGALGKFAR